MLPMRRKQVNGKFAGVYVRSVGALDPLRTILHESFKDSTTSLSRAKP